MRAVDTNVLVFAQIDSAAEHDVARELLTQLAEDPTPWAIPWPCVYEFLRVVTHPRVFNPPVPMARAMATVRTLLASPTLVMLGESPRHLETMERVLNDSAATGNLVHDAHIAALCIENGVSELFTGDRDFARFPEVRVTNPFR
jgi:toxin-antitoxin system PIN domain toxin